MLQYGTYGLDAVTSGRFEGLETKVRGLLRKIVDLGTRLECWGGKLEVGGRKGYEQSLKLIYEWVDRAVDFLKRSVFDQVSQGVDPTEGEALDESFARCMVTHS